MHQLWRRRWFQVFCGISVLGILACYFSISHYVETSPNFCGLCHKPRQEYRLWGDSDHRRIICQKCHHVNKKTSLAMLRKYVFEKRSPNPKGKSDGHGGKVEGSACASCHLSHDLKWPQVAASAGHRVHLQKAKIDCLRCHARSIHSFDGALDSCAECHERESKRKLGMQRLHCMACHNFLTRKDTLKPSNRICVDCHQSRGMGEKTAAMTHFSCQVCHQPHSDEPVAASACIGCHTTEKGQGLHSTPQHSQCTVCHKAHTWSTTKKDCFSCHLEQYCREAKTKDGCWSCHPFSWSQEEKAVQ